jgi:type IV secretory pathway VirB10-like protein
MQVEFAIRGNTMGLFSNIMNKIFHGAGNADAPDDAVKPGQGNESRVSAAARQGVPVAQATPNAPAPAAAAAAAPGAAPAPPPMQQVDVAAVLDRMAASHGEKLDWKHSIVDLMKLLGMDSSLSERKELAADLHYTGDTGDSAKMNMWLHKEVMRKLAENGGKVPADLLSH